MPMTSLTGASGITRGLHHRTFFYSSPESIFDSKILVLDFVPIAVFFKAAFDNLTLTNHFDCIFIFCMYSKGEISFSRNIYPPCFIHHPNVDLRTLRIYCIPGSVPLDESNS